MSTKGEQIAAAAEAMVGTPFRHQGRNPRSGVDCVGVVLCSVWSAGCELPDCFGYGPLPKADMLLAELGKRARRVHRDDAQPGDVLVFAYKPELPMHFAVLVGAEHIVHAHGSTGRVIKHRLTNAWNNRLHSIWRAEGVDG